MSKSLYYMHPINTYDTPLEHEQLELISGLFPGWVVVNPNETRHQSAADCLKQEGGNTMAYFTRLAASCQGGIVLPFRDGTIGAGIWKEFDQLTLMDLPVWELTCEGTLSRLKRIDKSRRLSVEDTRARIRNEDGSSREY